jgi:hypothetical protein
MNFGSLKAGRVAQIFGVQLQNKILWEQFCFFFFTYCCSLLYRFLYLLF